MSESRAVTATTALLALLPLLLLPAGAAAEAATSRAETPPRPVAPPPELAPLRAEIVERVESGELPSVAVAVLDRGELVWFETLGWADREARRRATVETPYGLASLGKSITATAVMTLVERGAIDLDRPINDYLGEAGLFSPGGHAGEATVRQVLDMTAAIPHGGYSYFERRDGDRLTAAEMVRRRGLVALPPGTAHVYSNFAYGVLELLIERVSGRGYADYLAAELFAPLGMAQASAGGTTAPPGGATRYTASGEPARRVFPRPRSSLAMSASLTDLVRYARLHLGLPGTGARPLLAGATIERMHRDRASLPGAAAPPLTGLGWGSIELEGGLLWLLSNGRSTGAQSTLTLVPAHQLAVAVLVNRTGNDSDDLAFRIADRLVPGLLDKMGAAQAKWEAAARRDYRPAAELAGSWIGSVRAAGGPLELALDFQPDGDVHVRLGDGPRTLLSRTRWEEGGLTGSFLGELPLDEAPEGPHWIDLALYPGERRLEGWAVAHFANDRGRFTLPAHLELRPAERSSSESPGAASAASTIFLVRHAEALYPPPEDDPRDPPLNRLGRERAARLADVLGDAGIGSILSTDLERTLQTAGPLAERLGLEIEIYDHRKLPELAERLASTPGRFLVSGHSNTTPELVRLLGGEPGEPIDEKTEFDRLYVVTVAPGRPASTVLLHYGEPPGSWPPDDPAALAEP